MMTNRAQTYLQIFALALGIWGLSVSSVWAATLSVSPSTGVYTAGETFTTRIIVNTAGAAINAAEATLKFDPSKLSVLSVRKGGTFSLWAVEPSYSNSAGTLSFGGGSPAGYTGSAGTVLTVSWRSKGAGPARVSFQNGSVLAADGRGTNVVQSLNGGSYTIAAADVQPEPEVIEYIAPANTPGRPVVESSHPEDGWSQATTASLSWTVPSDVTAVRTLLDGNSGSIPTKVYEPPISEIELPALEEGEQYFHLQFRNAEGWGRVAHFRLAVDTQEPESFSIDRNTQFDSTSPTQELQLTVVDDSSPVTRFMVQHNGGTPYEYIDETGSSTLRLDELAPGEHTFVIEAFDAAGNSRVATYTFAIDAFTAPAWNEYPSQLRADVVPVFYGKTRPSSTVYATITPINGDGQDTAAYQYEVAANASGTFAVVPASRFTEGVYEITAYAVDTHGARSFDAEPIRFSVTKPGYVLVGQWALSVLSIVVPLVALCILLVLLVLYGVARIRRVRQYVITETAEAKTVLDQQFADLRTVLDTDAEELASSRKAKKLTKAEAELVDTMRTRIDDAYKKISKEISDVDDIVE